MKKVLMMGLLLGSLMCGSCSKQNADGAKAPTRVKIEKVSASSGVDGSAYVGIVEEREATAVSFTSMGTVRRVVVSEGQHVSRGQLLAEMDDTQARNLLAAAEAMAAQANDALERYGKLHANGSLPEVQWVEVQSKVAQAQSQLEVARKNVADCRLTAPVSGIVGRKMVGAGETAMPSQAVVTILDISSVKVKVSVPEADMSSLSTQTPSTVVVEAVQRRFSGGRVEKGVQGDPLTHTYDVRVSVDNREHLLLPGMVATVRFDGLSAQPADQQLLTLPVTAVQKSAEGRLFVWTVGSDSTAHRAVVSVGPTTGNRIAITSGLDDGSSVVVEGYQKLSEGSQVVY